MRPGIASFHPVHPESTIIFHILANSPEYDTLRKTLDNLIELASEDTDIPELAIRANVLNALFPNN